MSADDLKVAPRRRCCNCTLLRAGIALFIVGATSLALGLATPTIMHKVINDQLDDGLRLDTGDSQLFSQWQSSEKIPIYMRYYVFNLTNPEEFRAGAPAVLKEFGPYTYNEMRVKFDIWFNVDRSQVRYKQHRTYTFAPELSIGNDKVDRYTFVNVPVVTFAQQLASLGAVPGFILDEILKLVMKEAFTTVRTVNEILWGYEDTMLKDLMALEKTLGLSLGIVTPIFGLQTNDSMPDWTNDSMVYTGQYEINNVAVMTQWDGKVTLPYWGSIYANMINGTDGYQFHPDIKDDEVLPVFVDDLFRSAYLEHTADVKVQGITLKRFQIKRSLLANAQEDPDAAAFYAFGPSGVLNLTSATGGPIFVTKPHFLDADPFYISNTQGLTPQKMIHDTWLDIEPITGATMNAAKRLQINVRTEPSAHIEIVGPNVRTMLVPLIWGEEAATITPSLASDFKQQVYLPINVGKGLNIAGIVVGALGLAASLIVLARYFYLKRKHRLDPERSSLIGADNTYETLPGGDGYL